MILFLFFITALIGGTNPAVVKSALEEFTAPALNTLRFTPAALFMLPFLVTQKISFAKNKKYLLLVNLFFAANVIVFSLGITKTTVIMANIIYLPTSLIVALFGYLFLKEKLSKLDIVGLALTMVGMAVLVLGSITTEDISSLGTPLGNFLISFAVLSWTLYTILSRKIKDDYTPLAITFANFIVTATIAALLMVKTDFIAADFANSVEKHLATIIYLSAISTVGFFFLYQWLVAKTSAFATSLISYLALVFSAAAGIIAFQEKITLNLVVGGSFIVIGVFFATSFKYARSKIGQ